MKDLTSKVRSKVSVIMSIIMMVKKIEQISSLKLTGNFWILIEVVYWRVI